MAGVGETTRLAWVENNHIIPFGERGSSALLSKTFSELLEFCHPQIEHEQFRDSGGAAEVYEVR